MEEKSLLKELNLPGDLKGLTNEDLGLLAEEIRERLIDIVSKRGGHLASNLGVVELTLALYSIWNPYETKIVWDVGHQTYVHKILTGRNDAFESLRQKDGLSGFPKREESLADSFNTGHSSTSISAALGIMRGQKLQGNNDKVIAIIGDGALTGGMAYEALNDASKEDGNLLIILNDNGMSIGKNVGAMSRYLGRIRTGRSYIRLKKGFKKFLIKIPLIGEKLINLIQKFKISIRVLVIPGEIFEELGFKYLGPIDGHNFKALKNAFNKSKYIEKPCLIHLVTQKGYGYGPAMENPDFFHGVSAFDKDSGTMKKSQALSFSKSFSDHICKLAKDDKRICAVTAAMQNGTGLTAFEKEFPDRFFDVGIAEQHAITMAAGLAVSGMKPVVTMYSSFLQRAYDQLIHDACLQSLHLTLLIDRAGVCGPDGETHQGIFDIGFLSPLPNITIAAPATVEEQKDLLNLALEHEGGPFAIRYPAYDTFSASRERIISSPVKYGESLLMLAKEDYYDLVFVALGNMVDPSIKAAEILKVKGYKVNVINARFVKPLDEEAIYNSLKKSKAYITVEDGVSINGFGSLVLKKMNERGLNINCRILGLPDKNICHGNIPCIHKDYGLDPESLAKEATNLIHFSV